MFVILSVVLDGHERHFPGQTLRREVDHKWNHVAILENVSHCWHRGKQNTVVERSEVKHREYGGREQGADVEVSVPGGRVVLL